MVKFDQLWFLFQHTVSLPCGPHTSATGVAVNGFPWHRSSHPNLRKSQSNTSQPSVFFHVREQKYLVRWCQIRTWRVINQFIPTTMQSSHCIHRNNCPGETRLPLSVFQAVQRMPVFKPWNWQGIHIIVSYICIVHTSFSYTRKFVMWTFGN